ncbi:bifunctional glycosyltransferase family 2 protein/CDP-glycerol:glycerophosphate glycerophosphotransferase [Streptomyces sp. B-S-A8]|uniref:Bifunctional glycosyltransferase family 2 protein/CDP-glycerol:glycerophosphate glycerophosphotransferase n=1 Tax=Streptomyces solicavernae TaxID=3043614 RepID=A0ABT6RYB2_9ACTN|nr:bifunctional glycosyltransferase family 2 protein/CDP-glycerol:glycerophosphate glycerophosphotransferase [Streptomyces sp. B-S-A8]MDI3389410.1 bifunctional glycosyltransferase family 2 protein/CDP-glycerol:glycerophosphate glycerophosphotransferase [Streptomyces sp. B-S-A8]
MPRFSVIVPAYKVQAYLREALHSVLRQSFADLELIAVDDCSPDGSGELIDELAAADPRVRPVHLPENVGLGRARNAGIEHATGDYLIFLDGDDTLTPGALQATADRLKETGSPDVLVYDYARTYWTGREVRNMQAAQLAEDGPAPFRLAGRPGLLKLLMVVWNKAYSREFIERQGFRFPPGYYEDTPWTYPVLMAAETIATLDRVCVHYRQRRQGNILGTTSRKHFDIFDQYDRVFAHLDARPEFAEWRPVVFRRMVDHYLTVFARPDRLPRRSRPAFLRRARAQYRRHRVPGLRLDPRTRVRHCLVRFAAHRTYRTLRLAKAARLRLGAAAGAVRRGARAALLRLHYRVQLCLPVRDDRAVFAAYRGHGHGGNPGAVEEKVRELAPHLRTAWLAGPAHHHTVPTATRRITPGSAAYWTALARSKYLVHDSGFGHRLVKRRGQVRVQTQRGTPLALTGLDLQDRPAAARTTDFGALLDDVDTWDYVLSGNRHSTLVWERVHPGSYTTLEYGRPANDRLLQAGSREVARLRDGLGIPPGNVAILYAPTSRDHRRAPHRPLDLDRVLRVLGPRFTVLTRAHPVYDQPLSSGEHARLVDVSDHPSVESLCLASDALLTDYSSLMCDYANLDRPIVLYADDLDVYEATRGTYLDLRSCAPGAVAQDEDELIDIFATGHWRGSRSAQLRAAFRARFCGLDDGRAAERVVRHVFLGQSTGLPPMVPLADRRPAPVPPPGEHLPEQSQGPSLLPTYDN